MITLFPNFVCLFFSHLATSFRFVSAGIGNAFVRYQTLDMAHRAKVELSGQYIGKFQCKIGYGKATPTTRIWVGDLGAWTSVTQLEREFDRFGAIKKIEYNKGDTQAYILYDSIDAAMAAVKEMHGFPLGAPDRRIRIDFADNGTTPSFSKRSGGFEEGGEYRRGPDYEYPEGGASYEENSSYGYGGRPFRGRCGFRGGFHRDGPPHHGDNDEGVDQEHSNQFRGEQVKWLLFAFRL
ncbi:RNA-binding protein spenito-like [Armigeres subalbatus]|uniref:RNA-binding protein spenito-like n=1 Tax=Armigeres subalbatus TaxID=124917 RepID=UPI002ECFBCAD